MLLVGKNIPRWWKIDSNEMRQRRLLFQGLVRGTGRCRLIIPVHITRSYSCKSPTLPDRDVCISAPRLVFPPMWLWLTNVMQLSSQSKLGDTTVLMRWGWPCRQARKFAWCPTHVTAIFLLLIVYAFTVEESQGRGGLKGSCLCNAYNL